MITAQQARSRATEERILEAAETLLRDRPFDELSVTDIASDANISVGGFYARFEGKDALLVALHERYEARRTLRLGEAFAEERWADSDTRDRVRGVVGAMVDLMLEERHVLRTFLLRYWSRPEDATRVFTDRLGALYKLARQVLLLDRDAMRVDDPEEAARTAVAIVMGACRDILVMKGPSQPGHPRLSRDRLIDYLTATVLAVVGLPAEGAVS